MVCVRRLKLLQLHRKPVRRQHLADSRVPYQAVIYPGDAVAQACSTTAVPDAQDGLRELVPDTSVELGLKVDKLRWHGILSRSQAKSEERGRAGRYRPVGVPRLATKSDLARHAPWIRLCGFYRSDII